MKHLINVFIFVFLFSLPMTQIGNEDQFSMKKVDKVIARHLDSKTTVLNAILISGEIKAELSGNLHNKSLFSIDDHGEHVGYVFLSSAMGRYDFFDYLVIYDTAYIIRHVAVIEYRSDHGFEITNKKWLKQFVGTSGCDHEYGYDIQAISGATLSANSITSDISILCQIFQQLQHLDLEIKKME